MASKTHGTLQLSALILGLLASFSGAARPQLAWDWTGTSKIGVEVYASAEPSSVKLCGNHSDEVCNLPGLNGVPHVRMRAGYVTVSEVSDRRLWYLVADREDWDTERHTQPQQQQQQHLQQQQQQTVGMAMAATVEAVENMSGTAGDIGADVSERVASHDQDRRPRPRSEAAPVILWLTGGPGCSSLDAFIYEHGPFKFRYAPTSVMNEKGGSLEQHLPQQQLQQEEKKRGVEEEEREREGEKEGEGEGEASVGVAGGGRGKQGRELQQQRQVVLEANPYSWTKVATVIYVDSPAGVGMSYSGRPEIDYHTNDEYTIADLVVFLEGLTDRYPELATAPFFLAGESYGGVFVPMLARKLLQVNQKRSGAGRRPLVNLQGYSVGNPVTDDVIDGNAQMFFAADMGYVDPPSWTYMRAVCKDMFWNATRDSDCWDAQGVVKDDLWDLNWYDVLDPCARPDDAKLGNAGSHRQRNRVDLERRFYWPFTARMGVAESDADGLQGAQQQLEEGRRGGRRLWGPWLRHVVPCMDRRIALDWLNRGEVRAALHAAPFSIVDEWQPCSDELYYRLDTMDLVPVHEDLVRQGLRALVYSGDHDMVVPHTGTRTWLYEKAKLGSTDGPLRPWMLQGQIAGFTARFSEGTGLRFATVKGAGHMVPQSKPLEALHMLKAFLYDEEL